MQDIYNLLLNKIDESQIRIDEPMSKHTTFKIGGPADLFVVVKSVDELKYVLETAKESSTPVTIIRKPEVMYW